MLSGNTRHPAVLALVLGAAATLAGCELAVQSWSAEAREPWSREYTLAEQGRVELSNKNGSITVQPSTDGRVHVDAEKIAKAATDESARESLKSIEIVEQADASVVRLETKSPSGGLLGGGSFQVRYTIRLPETVEIRVDNTNGQITIQDVGGAVDVETTNGGIKGSGLRGVMKAETTNGGIEADIAALTSGGLELSTTNGSIRLTLPADAKADLSASVANGSIDTGDLAVESTETSRRRLEGRLNGGGPRIKAETVNGSIRLARR